MSMNKPVVVDGNHRTLSLSEWRELNYALEVLAVQLRIPKEEFLITNWTVDGSIQEDIPMEAFQYVTDAKKK